MQATTKPANSMLVLESYSFSFMETINKKVNLISQKNSMGYRDE
jgi:hypothetical protein